MSSPYGDPQGEGWYVEGTMGCWSVTSPWDGGEGVRYVADPSDGCEFMDAPKSVVIDWWITQYYLTVTSTYGQPEGEGWYDAGSEACWFVESPISGGEGIQYVADPNSGCETMNAPQTVNIER